jgi:3-hydroxyacyl-CoA dehydrogenase
MEIKALGVIGAGQMGNGIAQIAAMSGLDVIMNDISDEFVQRGMGRITKILSRGVDKGKMSEDDKNAVLGMNHPMGPLTLADLIGLDTCLAIMQTLYDGFNDSKYRPCPLLRKYVEAGWLGRKTGRGFYEYN